jgi:hypothetical protein
MRIDNSYLSGITAGAIRANQDTSAAPSRGDVTAPIPQQDNLHVPSAELIQLRQLLQASPQTRPDVMARVGQLLQSGYYNSPEAAQQTAQAMIQAVE